MSLPGNTPRRPLVMSIRPMAPDDLPYVRAVWKESYKDAPTVDRMPWAMYKATVGKTIDELVGRSDVNLLGGYADNGKVIGWICYSPGRSISTVHWTHTRFKLDDDKCRRRGVMTDLILAADLGKRLAYTFRGPRRRVHHGGKDRSPDAVRHSGRGDTLDLSLVEWLRSRGVSAAFVPISEWLK